MRFKHGVINMDVINMEVKIKIGDEIIDAKIVMMNGDMIVSPKEVKFEPKDINIKHLN